MSLHIIIFYYLCFMNYKVYALACGDSGKIRYIGITKNSLSQRLNQHKTDLRRNKHKINWIKSLKGNIKIILIKDEIPSLKEANELEVYYISYYNEKGCKLVNKTAGGDGTKGFVSWNKGLKCSYIDKLIKNSPRARKVYCYDLNGFLIKEYSSIKKASEGTGVSRSQILKICNIESGYKTSKKMSFRFFKEPKIYIEIVSEQDRIKNVKKGKLESAREIKVIDKNIGETYIFKNFIEASKKLNMKKSSISTYASISKETKKYKFSYN